MRSLASELGVEAMSLYAHIPSKEVLLGLMAARVIDEVPTPARTLPPRTRLRRLAMGMRAAAQAHPHVFPLVVLLPFELASSLRPTEIALQCFARAGQSDRRAIRSQRVFLSYVRGYLLWEIGGFAAGRWRDERGRISQRALAELDALDSRQYPEAKRLRSVFMSILPGDAFVDGLRCVLDSLLPATERKRT